MRFSELRCKEVINVCTGQRLGYVGDLDIDAVTGELKALIVPGRLRLFGLLGREDDYVVPFGCVKTLGSDIILTELSGEYPRAKAPRRSVF